MHTPEYDLCKIGECIVATNGEYSDYCIWAVYLVLVNFSFKEKLEEWKLLIKFNLKDSDNSVEKDAYNEAIKKIGNFTHWLDKIGFLKYLSNKEINTDLSDNVTLS